MNLKKSKTAKFVAGFVGFAFALSLVVAPVTSSAQSTADLNAMIARLMAEIAALQGLVGGGSASSGHVFTTDLTVGSTGAEVVALQRFLVSKGFLTMPAGVAMGTFGPLTRAALANYQAANAITPAAGYFGPITRAKVNSQQGPITPPTPPTTPGTPPTTPGTPPGLQGEAGSVDSYDLQSEFNNEDIGEGEEEVEVMSFEVEVDNGSDIDVTSMKVWFENQDTGSSEDFDDFADSVQIWLDGEMVGEADVEDFSADDTSGTETDNSTSDAIDEWEKTISLDGAVIEAGETMEFIISVTAVNSIDSADHDSDDWDVDVTNVRFEDASGAVISEDPEVAVTPLNFGTFATAADIEMKVSTSDDNLDSRVENVDASSDTDGIQLLKFEIEAEGSDITINDIPVLLTISQPTVTDDVDFLLNSLVLTVDGTEYSESVSGNTAGLTATITFDDLDITIEEGDTLEFTVSGDFNDTQAAEFIDGDTVTASLGATQVNNIDADDSQGDAIGDDDATGTANGESVALYDVGIQVDFVSVTSRKTFEADAAGEKDRVEFTYRFDITSFDSDLFLDKELIASSTPDATTDGNAYATTTQSTTGTSTGATSAISASDTEDGDTSFAFELEEDDPRSFTLKVELEAQIDGLIQTYISGFNWGTAGALDSDADKLYNFNLNDYLSEIMSVQVI